MAGSSRYHDVVSQILDLEGLENPSSVLPQALKGLEELLLRLKTSMGQPILYISHTMRLVSTRPHQGGAPQRMEWVVKKILGSIPGDGELYKLTREGLQINTAAVNIPYYARQTKLTIAEGSFLIKRRELLELIVPKDQGINGDPQSELLIGYLKVDRDFDYFDIVISQNVMQI